MSTVSIVCNLSLSTKAQELTNCFTDNEIFEPYLDREFAETNQLNNFLNQATRHAGGYFNDLFFPTSITAAMHPQDILARSIDLAPTGSDLITPVDNKTLLKNKL